MSDAFPLVRENSTSKEKEPVGNFRLPRFRSLSLSLSLSLFACLRAFFIPPNFVSIDVVVRRGHPHGDVALISERGRHRCKAHARVPKKNHRKKKSARVLPRTFFFFFFVVAQKHGKKRSRCPKTKRFLCFCLFDNYYIEVLHSLTYSNRQTDRHLRKEKDLRKKKKKEKKIHEIFIFGR